MPHSLSTIDGLPAKATNCEALAWVSRMRRIVDRWEALPDGVAVTPERKQRAYRELDKTEAMIRGNMV